MSNYKPHFGYSAIILILFQSQPKDCARSVFAVQNELVEIFNNGHAKEIATPELNITERKNKNMSYMEFVKPTLPPFVSLINYTPPKKWSVDTRFTRRQYEIINMLWRKTKIFLDQADELRGSILEQNNITTKPFNLKKKTRKETIQRDIKQESENTKENKYPALFTTRLSEVQHTTSTSTTSNIEFYYFYDVNIEDNMTKKFIPSTKCQENITSALNFSNAKKPNSSFVVFHIKGPAIVGTKEKWYTSRPLLTTQYRNTFFSKRNRRIFPFLEIARNQTRSPAVDLKNNANIKKFKLRNVTSSAAKHKVTVSIKKELNKNCSPSPANLQQVFSKSVISNLRTIKYEKVTTPYDKIKFFEIYDRMTPVSNSEKKSVLQFDYNEELNKPNQARNEKILLSHVDQGSHDHDQAKHSKKHIKEDKNQSIDISCSKSKEENEKPTRFVFKAKNVKKNTTHHLIEFEKKSLDDVLFSYSNKTVQWSEYPFAAVYIYAPSQIHCDAAGISAHWLVASASCLSRLDKNPNPNSEGRSAFVAYCGENWWQPERVSYVKYTFVHPWFHPSDKTRRHLYNIGVIQVVTSMTTCSGWAPVDLISHPVTTPQDGMLASAVGWGLDRFDTRSSAVMNLPKTNLTVYKSRLFSDSCPGNYEYNNARHFGENGYISSLYCLSLPPYFGEEHDPVHGGLLLASGKLIAVYLQEERRPWGEQSAQYTGIWRLIPWITDTAKETEEIETSFFEI